MENNDYDDHDFTNGEMVFHYSREERLKTAPENVRQYYNGTGPKPPRGLFKCLVATKANRVMLLCMIAVLALFIGLYFFGSKGYEGTLDDTDYELSAFSFEDTIYVSISTEGEIKDPVEVKIDAMDVDEQVSNSITLSNVDIKEQKIRTTFENHDIISISATVKNTLTGDEIVLVKKVEEK